MLKSLALISVLATAAAASAQTAEIAPQDSAPATTQSAPIERSYQSNNSQGQNQAPQSNDQTSTYGGNRAPITRRRHQPDQDQIVDSQPVSGVWIRSRSQSVVKTISATPQKAEMRVEHGVLNVNVHHPADHAEILVDLPGGQTSLLKDGLYTFNADTNTVRVLHGEAAAYAGASTANEAAANHTGKPVKVKEGHQLAFNGAVGQVKPVEAYPYELSADLLPMGVHGDGGGSGYAGADGGYEYPGYYSGFAGGYGYYPYGFYPYGYGIGLGYYGGFGYGFRGGYRGGFGGGGFRGGGFRR